ncbi:hypothetical protein [Rhodopila sp.]|uniref:hypothetical protein n=1 Tax=Rhodopila sp. TaxID=2480087 RepID=UPI003D13C0A3
MDDDELIAGGTGSGGDMLEHRLAQYGTRITLIERSDYMLQSRSNRHSKPSLIVNRDVAMHFRQWIGA